MTAGRERVAPVEVGERLPELVRVTDLAHWNRYAAVNDEFIDVHMDPDAARRAGQADVFGMGNLRVGYLHGLLQEWLGDRGDVSRFACQFRALNFRGDELRTWGAVTERRRRDGLEVGVVDLGVRNQRGEETTPATAEVVLFDAAPEMPPLPPREPAPTRTVGTYLDAETISWLGRPLEPLVSLPVGANDLRRWAQAVWYPDPPPVAAVSEAVAREGPWAGLVAARDFNPYAWQPDFHPDAYPWMRGMGTEPGYRGLNGAQQSWYNAPIRPGDVISSEVCLVDAYEKDGRGGTMLFLVDESRWTNQRQETVRVTRRTTIYH